MTRVRDVLTKLRPTQQTAAGGQRYRFLSEIVVGDDGCTYDPGQRRYCIGRVLEGAGERDHPLGRWRRVEWCLHSPRDVLGSTTRNSLGAILTLFRIPESAAAELLEKSVPIVADLLVDLPRLRALVPRGSSCASGRAASPSARA